MEKSDDNTNNLCEKCNLRHKPNKELLEALDEAEKIASGEVKTKCYRNIDELFRDLEIDN